MPTAPTSSAFQSRPAHNSSPMSKLYRSTMLQIAILAICVLASARLINTQKRDACVSESSPNPAAQQYPELISGNLNGTTLIVPITIERARELIPEEWGIAENAYRSLLPSFPAGMYPMMAQIVHDHDIQLPAYNVSLQDFSRASFEFPFIDIFHDGQSSFRWAGSMMISAENPMAIGGTQSYGIKTYPAVFDPRCDAYKALPNGRTSISSKSSGNNTSKYMSLETGASWDNIPYSLDFFKNITNQPTFADTPICDYYQRLFNTTLTSGANAPVPIVGTVEANMDPFPCAQSWQAE
ncbi:Uu.00g083670.m01.CDS01 [Anthostomella pinea]|uniref:Uu.00g083670.m01.CDS01 n=1 Tax=Anthostomella pinea TaxID=933095 RepID=A0AAI8VMJ1_9PEZI|nr:Uu.00g083670.m01.CDS01 [Anthostomella pinea]